MTATYFILLDLKSRHKPIRLLPHPSQSIPARTIDGQAILPASSIPANLLREKNQDATARSRTVHRHPPPADLLLISQQEKPQLPPTGTKKPHLPSTNDERHRNHKTPNKENVDNSHSKRQERTTPTVKWVLSIRHDFQRISSSTRTPNCQRILMFAESPGGSRRPCDKKGGKRRLSSSNEQLGRLPFLLAQITV